MKDSNLYCRKHPTVELQGHEVEGFDFRTQCGFTYDVDYCPSCWDEYENTGIMNKPDIATKDAFWQLVNEQKDWVK